MPKECLYAHVYKVYSCSPPVSAFWQQHSRTLLEVCEDGLMTIRKSFSPDKNLTRHHSPSEHDMDNIILLLFFKICTESLRCETANNSNNLSAAEGCSFDQMQTVASEHCAR